MTAIVGYTDGHAMVLGADSAGVTDRLIISCAFHKIFTSGDGIVGVSGGVRIGQLIRFQGARLELGDDGPVPSLLRWIQALRVGLGPAGVLRTKDGVEELADSRMLVGLAGRWFEIDSEWQIIEPATPYWAIGSGQLLALGALHTMASLQECLDLAHRVEIAWTPRSPRDRVTTALQAAAMYDPGVRAPFEFVERPVR